MLKKDEDVAGTASQMRDKVCLVTGATSGIGLVTAQTLARQGATVVLVGRNPERGAMAVRHIVQETGNTAVTCLIADLSSQAQVRHLSQEFRHRFEHLHVLVNNAGALFTKRRLSADGLEMTFALNHLGYFLLTHTLLDTLKASAPARIVNVASDAHYKGHIQFTDLQGQQRYSGWRAYCQSKLANILFTYSLTSHIAGTRVTANALHPGFVATRFGRNNVGAFALLLRVLQWVARSPEQGAATVVHLATSPAVAGVTGTYFVDCRRVRSAPESYDKTVAERLWQISADMVGLKRGDAYGSRID